MYIRRNVRPGIIIWFSWKQVLIFLSLSAAVHWLYHFKHWSWIGIPFLPVATIGTAVAFYLGFKNNSSYERLWEARKIWAAIIVECRSLAINLTTLGEQSEERREEFERKKQVLVRRQISWANVLRLQLRKTTNRWNAGRVPPEVRLIDKLHENQSADNIESNVSSLDMIEIEGKSNPALELLRLQVADLNQMRNGNLISEHTEQRLNEVALNCIEWQTAAERIKTFPFPRQYAYFSSVFVWIFMLLLPFSLVGEVFKDGSASSWLVIPFSTLISWIFLTMEQVGDTSEDPFEGGLNDVPMSSLCRHIEIELLEMLGVKVLPEPLRPVADVLL